MTKRSTGSKRFESREIVKLKKIEMKNLGQGHSPCIRICIYTFTSAMQGSAPLNLA